MKTLPMRSPAVALLVLLALGGCDQPTEPPPPPPPARVATVTVTPGSDTLDVGQTRQFTAEVRDSAGKVLTGRTVSWAVRVPAGSESAGTVDESGRVTVTRSASNVFSRKGLEVVATVDSVQAVATIDVRTPPTSIHIRGSALMLAGRSLQFVGEGVDTFSTAYERPLAWSSSDTSVVSVSASGVVTARRVGTARITAAAVNATQSTEVRVIGQGYGVTPLGALGGSESRGLGINDFGQVVGWARTASGQTRAFVWAGRMTDLGTLRSQSAAYAIDNQGRVAGDSNTPANEGHRRPVVWENGTPRVVADVDGTAVAINERGQVLIGSYPVIRWEAGRLDTLPTRSGSSSVFWSSGSGMNARGDVVGAGILNGTSPAGLLFRDGTVTPVFFARASPVAAAINDRGQVVGWAAVGATECPGRNERCGLLWENGRTTRIGFRVNPAALNERGQVVGRTDVSSPRRSQGWFWEDGRLTVLDAVVAGDEWTVEEVNGINESGQMAGTARSRATGGLMAVLLTPPSP